MASDDELLAKLEAWMAAHSEPPTIFDAIATRDGELFAAYVLKAFRGAARQAVIERLEHEPLTTFPEATAGAANPVMRVFDGLAGAWKLTEEEKLVLLGISEPAHLQALRASALDDVPIETIERVIILLDIFKAINVLLCEPRRADSWMRSPNSTSIFGGRSALDVMAARGLEGLREVRAYLNAELWST